MVSVKFLLGLMGFTLAAGIGWYEYQWIGSGPGTIIFLLALSVVLIGAAGLLPEPRNEHPERYGEDSALK